MQLRSPWCHRAGTFREGPAREHFLQSECYEFNVRLRFMNTLAWCPRNYTTIVTAAYGPHLADLLPLSLCDHQKRKFVRHDSDNANLFQRKNYEWEKRWKLQVHSSLTNEEQELKFQYQHSDVRNFCKGITLDPNRSSLCRDVN